MGKRKPRHAADATETPPAPARKLLFLDIDGVLAPFGGRDPPVPRGSQRVRKNSDEAFAPFDDGCLARLADIVEATGCDVVLSSSWRASEAAVAVVERRFRAHGPPLSARVPFELMTGRGHTVRQREAARATTFGSRHSPRRLGLLDARRMPLDARRGPSSPRVGEAMHRWEIARFLDEAPCRAAAWCALDDEPLVEGAEQARHRDRFRGHAVLVESSVGLTAADAETAIRILGG